MPVMRTLSASQKFKHTAAGDIPVDWQCSSFGRLAEFRNGLNYSESSTGFDVPILGVGDFQKLFRFDPKNLQRIRINIAPPADAAIEKGDMIFVRSNGNRALIGRVLYFADVPSSIYHSGFTIRARITDQATLLPEFAARFFQSSTARREISRFGGGTNISNLSQELLSKIVLPLPTIKEQEQICRVIDSCEKTISSIDEIVVVKSEHRRGLVQQLLTGQNRFRIFVKKRGRYHTRFADYPNDWPLVHIGDFAREVSTRNSSDAEIPVLSCTKHAGLVESLKYFGKQIFSDDKSNYKIVRRGQFAYATNHIEEGSIGYQDLFDDALISPIYTVFETDDSIHHRFLYRVLKSELYRHIFEINTSSSVDRRGSLRWDEFSKISVALPSYEEQSRIADLFQAYDDEIDVLKKQADALRDQQRQLTQELLTGQIRLRAA